MKAPRAVPTHEPDSIVKRDDVSIDGSSGQVIITSPARVIQVEKPDLRPLRTLAHKDSAGDEMGLGCIAAVVGEAVCLTHLELRRWYCCEKLSRVAAIKSSRCYRVELLVSSRVGSVVGSQVELLELWEVESLVL